MPPAFFDLCHVVTTQIEAPAGAAFGFLADPIRLGRWSLGCMETAATAVPGVYSGTSLYDCARGFFAIDARAETLEVDWRVGSAPEALTHRISARVLPGEPLGYAPDTCLVTLIAWRPEAMSEPRWRRLCAAHDAEIWLIKAQIEAVHASGPQD